MPQMSWIQLKTTYYDNKQQNHNLNEGRQLPGANAKISQMLGLSDKECKADIIKNAS